MLRAPRDEVLVLGEHGVDQLVQDVLDGLTQELGVRMQGLVRLAFETGDEPEEFLVWARAALEAARRVAAKRPKRGRSK